MLKTMLQKQNSTFRAYGFNHMPSFVCSNSALTLDSIERADWTYTNVNSGFHRLLRTQNVNARIRFEGTQTKPSVEVPQTAFYMGWQLSWQSIRPLTERSWVRSPPSPLRQRKQALLSLNYKPIQRQVIIWLIIIIIQMKWVDSIIGNAAGRNPVVFGHCRFKSYSTH